MTWLLGSHLSCVHTWFSLPAPDIWQTPSKSISDILQMKMNQKTICDGVSATYFRYWNVFFSGRIYDIFNCVHSPFRMTFPTCCLQSQIGRERKEKEKKKRFGFTITVQSYPGALITWNRNWHILAFYAIFHSEQFWGHVFHKYPLCDGISGVRWSKSYNPLLRVSTDGKVRKIRPCFSLLIWQKHESGGSCKAVPWTKASPELSKVGTSVPHRSHLNKGAGGVRYVTPNSLLLGRASRGLQGFRLHNLFLYKAQSNVVRGG